MSAIHLRDDPRGGQQEAHDLLWAKFESQTLSSLNGLLIELTEASRDRVTPRQLARYSQTLDEIRASVRMYEEILRTDLSTCLTKLQALEIQVAEMAGRVQTDVEF